jgi:hypothetical protein
MNAFSPESIIAWFLAAARSAMAATKKSTPDGRQAMKMLLVTLIALPAFAAPAVELDFGAGAAMTSSAEPTGALSTGPALKLELAVELHERVSVSLFALGSAHRGAASSAGTGAPEGGDLTQLTPGASVRVNMLGFDDALGARRVWLYARGGLGWTLMWPAGRSMSGGLMLFGALGIEYRAHLKGFAIGLEVAPHWWPGRHVFGGAVMPNLRYTF